MAGLRLDGAGQAKMVTLDDCTAILQRVHNLVEQYALSIKQGKPQTVYLNNIRRQLPTMAGKLKGQFGMISDLVTSINMQSSRGSSEPIRVRTMREGVAAIKAQLDIAIAQTINKHEAKDG
jgi:hypothetical protein